MITPEEVEEFSEDTLDKIDYRTKKDQVRRQSVGGFFRILASWFLDLQNQILNIPVGPKGDKGDVGDTGPAGAQGPIGETGPMGPQGNLGPQGNVGAKGDTGLTGPAGDTGATGAPGPQGDVGPQGNIGPKGDIGLTGPQGFQGVQGIQGPIGTQGIQGVKGDKGDKGNDGTSVNIKGTLPSTANLPTEGNVSGDGYLIDGFLYVWTGFEFTNVGQIQGPKGEQGDPGEEGPAGSDAPVGRRFQINYLDFENDRITYNNTDLADSEYTVEYLGRVTGGGSYDKGQLIEGVSFTKLSTGGFVLNGDYIVDDTDLFQISNATTLNASGSDKANIAGQVFTGPIVAPKIKALTEFIPPIKDNVSGDPTGSTALKSNNRLQIKGIDGVVREIPNFEDLPTSGGGSGDVTGAISIESIRLPGESDTVVTKRAAVLAAAGKKTLLFADREYLLTEFINADDIPLILGTKGDQSHGTRLKSAIVNFTKITGVVPAITAIPTASNPGPMNGCCFYRTKLTYYPAIHNITFIDYRFAVADLEAQNSPVFKHCFFYNCNVGGFAYQGCQNYNYISCSSAGTDVVHISSATCFPQGSTYAGGDNYYTDSLTIVNEGDYGSFGGAGVNDNFDNWFVASILRPNDLSYTTGGNSQKYLDGNGAVYSDASKYCRPSGRVFFCPMRNGRIATGWRFKSIDIRGVMPRGFGLVNNAVLALIIEGQFLYEPYVSEGENGTVADQIIEVGAMITAENLVPHIYHPNFGINAGDMFAFTRRGYSEGFAWADTRNLRDINLMVNRPVTYQNFSRLLSFEQDKILNPSILYDEQTFMIYTDLKQAIRGATTKVTLYPQGDGAKVTFKENEFIVLTTDPIDYTKDIHIEFTWNGEKVWVKIFQSVSGSDYNTMKYILRSK